METLNQKGVSNWLTNLPVKEHGYEMTKQEFWDSSRLDITSHLIEFHLNASVAHHLMQHMLYLGRKVVSLR